MKRPKVIDLFCGCGGLSEGFIEVGFDVIVGVDNDKDMVESFKLNHPSAKTICEDISGLDSDKILDIAKSKKEDIDVIIGGPPCQGFSTVGNRRSDDPRNRLFYEFVRIVNDINPSVFVMENVSGLLTMQEGKVKDSIIEEFNKLGYDVSVSVLNAEEYGVPQKRRRVFFVGHRFKDRSFSFPKPERNDRFITVKEAIGDIPTISSNQSSKNYGSEPKNEFQRSLRNGQSILLDHKAANHSAIMIERIRNIKQGENHSHLPEHLKLSSGYPNIYGRLSLDRPSDTITGNCGCISAPGRFIHPTDDRAITVREAARLQTFKDSSVFVGSQGKKYKQVGNAVPPFLSRALALEIKKILL